MSHSVPEPVAEPPEKEHDAERANSKFGLQPGERLAFTVIGSGLGVLSALGTFVGPYAHSGTALIVMTCVVALAGTLAAAAIVLAVNRRQALNRKVPVPLMHAFAILLVVGVTGGVIGYLVGPGVKDRAGQIAPPPPSGSRSASAASTGAASPSPSPTGPMVTPSTTPTPSAVPATQSPSPLAPASSAAIPASAELDVQDPGGTGVYGVTFTSSGTFATGDLNGSAYLWSVAQGASTNRLLDRSGQAIFGIVYNPHGDVVAANTFNAPTYNDGSVVLWDAKSGSYINTLLDPGTMGVGSPAAFSPDGGAVAVSDADGGIYVWSTGAYKLLGTLYSPSTKPNYQIAYSPKTGYLAAANGDGTAYLWNTQTQKIVARFRDPDTDNQGLQSIAFSPDGSLLAAGDDNGNVYLWNAAEGTLVAKLPGLQGGQVRGIAFSPRVGALAATVGDDTSKTYEFRIWNTAGKLLTTRADPGSTGGTKLAFSPDGSLLAVGDTNDSTYVWDMSGLS